MGRSIKFIFKSFLLLTAFFVFGLYSASEITFAGVGTGPEFNNPRGTALDGETDLIFADFASGNIIRVDGKTGARTLISDSSKADLGPALSAPAGIVVLSDKRIFVSDLNLRAVVEVNRDNGKRTVITEAGAFKTPFGIASGPVNGGKEMLVVTETGSDDKENVIGPVIVDPDNGKVTQIPRAADETVNFNDPRAIAVNGSNIYVGNLGDGTIIHTDPSSGKRKIVSLNPNPKTKKAGIGEGEPFGDILDLGITRDGKYLFTADLAKEAVVKVDTSNGNRTIVTKTFGEMVGKGLDFVNPIGIEVVSETNIVVADFGLPGLVRVDGNGDRTVLTSSDFAGFGGPRDLAVLSDGTVAVADFSTERLIAVNRNGDRTLLSGPSRGDGTGFNGPVSVIELDADTIAVAEFNQFAIFAVDRKTGNRKAITGDGVGSGPTVSARGIALHPTDSNIIYATSFSRDAVMAVNRKTGERSIVSKAGTRGDGPALSNPLGIDIAKDGTIWVSDLGNDSIFKVDPATGNRTLVSGQNRGKGPGIENAFGITILDGRVIAVDSGGKTRALLEINQTTGDRTVISGPGVGTGPNFGNIFSMDILDDKTLVVSDFKTNVVIAVDASTGNRRIFSGAKVGKNN